MIDQQTSYSLPTGIESIQRDMDLNDSVYWNQFQVQDFHLNPGTLGCLSLPAKKAMSGWNESEYSPLDRYQLSRVKLQEIREKVRRIWRLKDYIVAINGGATSIFEQLTHSLIARHLQKNKTSKLKLITSEREHSGALACFINHPMIEVRTLKDSILFDANQIEETMDQEQPDVALLSLRTYDVFLKLPVRQLYKQIKSLSPDCITIIDIAQVIGIEEFHPIGDILVGSFHKWLFGPEGSGMIAMNPSLLEVLPPFVHGKTFDDDYEGGRFEQVGGHTFQLYHGLGASLDLYETLTPSLVASRSVSLASYLTETLHPIDHQRVKVENKGAVILIHGLEMDVYPVYQYLNEKKCYTKCIKAPNRYNHLRIGIPYFETRDRLLNFAETLEEALNHVARNH